ncbi:P2X purinoceptor 4 [Fukomys damarensis]|uniref:P2X purinoceptor n=1 Tax=Fukomys damarensis TaxID=885580 RepID=A0A091CZ72_FUKDA|nr:P2X purinoceptor 4 [Fukomys damarensis]
MAPQQKQLAGTGLGLILPGEVFAFSRSFAHRLGAETPGLLDSGRQPPALLGGAGLSLLKVLRRPVLKTEHFLVAGRCTKCFSRSIAFICHKINPRATVSPLQKWKGICGKFQSFFVISKRALGRLGVSTEEPAFLRRWVFVWEKGYQEKDSVVSSVTTKAKGVAVTNTSELGFRVWDVADYVVPAQEENSIFVMTNMIITVNQTQGTCPEIPDKTTVCQTHADCTLDSAGTHSNGVRTGRCVPFNASVQTCEVASWCPVEDDLQVPRPAFLKAAENFTLLVKNNIWYPKFNFTKFARYYRDLAGQEQRTLIKAYGIRFDVIVFGKAGKFDVIPTMINVGSGLALLGVATVLCDVIVLYCMKKRYYYREKKYKFVEDYEQGLAGDTDQ